MSIKMSELFTGIRRGVSAPLSHFTQVVGTKKASENTTSEIKTWSEGIYFIISTLGNCLRSHISQNYLMAV
jgi:hypothetical protein